MNTIFIPSVMHTGTHFCLGLFENWLRGQAHTHILPMPKAFHKATMRVVPLRHPDYIWQSWFTRSKPVEKLYLSFHNLARLDSLYQLVYLPVDLPGVRDDQLRFIADTLGISLETDWSRPQRGTWRNPRPQAPRADLSRIWALSFIQRFYGDPTTPNRADPPLGVPPQPETHDV